MARLINKDWILLCWFVDKDKRIFHLPLFQPGLMCRWCWAFPRWSVNTRAISWAPIPLFSLFSVKRIFENSCRSPLCSLCWRTWPWRRWRTPWSSSSSPRPILTQFTKSAPMCRSSFTRQGTDKRRPKFVQNILMMFWSTAPWVWVDGGDFSAIRVLSWPGGTQENSR